MTTLGADETIVLRIYAGLHAGVGQPVPLTTILVNWPPSFAGARLADAVEHLAAGDLLSPDPTGTAYALTDAGAALLP